MRARAQERIPSPRKPSRSIINSNPFESVCGRIDTRDRRNYVNVIYVQQFGLSVYVHIAFHEQSRTLDEEYYAMILI